MYYKILNKALLTSAMVTAICAVTSQVNAQKVTFQDDSVDISLPAPDVLKTPTDFEDDFIPLDSHGLIEPEQAVKVASKTADDTVKAVKNEAENVVNDAKNIADQAKSALNVAKNGVVNEVATISKSVNAPEQAPKPKNVLDVPPFDDDFVNDALPMPNEDPIARGKKMMDQKATDQRARDQRAPAANPASDPSQKRSPQNNATPNNRPDQHNPNVANMPNQNRPQAQRPDIQGMAPNGSFAPNQNKQIQSNAQVAPTLTAQQQSPQFGDSILAQTNNELFNQMSDIEKQTTLLTLELKREKIRNEVEAAKAVREQAEREKQAMEEAKQRQQEEWKKDQEAKVIREQTALKQKEIELEKVKQRKALTAYMNSMLEQKQLWIDETGKLREEIENLKQENKEIRSAYKQDLANITEGTKQILADAETAKNNHDRIVASLTAQNTQLKKRIEADAEAARNGGRVVSANGENVADGSGSVADSLITPINIAKEYAIMDITGKGEDLLVKLINKAGDSFTAKVGTVLQTGHMVEEIKPNYVQFDRNGLKDFLYISSSTMETEPGDNNGASLNGQTTQATPPSVNLVSEGTLPSISDGMFVK